MIFIIWSISMSKLNTRRALILAGSIAALPALAMAASKPAITTAFAWVRAAPAGATAGAAYLSITNTGSAPDRLIGGSSPVASAVELHEMNMDGGVMRMRPVTGGLAIPAGRTIALKPGGYHIMLIGLKAPLTAGTMVPLTLRFEKAGVVKLQVPVRPAQP